MNHYRYYITGTGLSIYNHKTIVNSTSGFIDIEDSCKKTINEKLHDPVFLENVFKDTDLRNVKKISILYLQYWLDED